MSEKSQRAAELFYAGFNCSQAVLAVFCEDYDLDADIALKMSCGLGGGCRCGELCGAVSGAVLVIGLKYGQDTPADLGAKANCYARTSQFIELFRQRHGSVVCRVLLGGDITTEEGLAMAADKNTSGCTELVKSAVQILEELGY